MQPVPPEYVNLNGIVSDINGEPASISIPLSGAGLEIMFTIKFLIWSSSHEILYEAKLEI